MEYYLVLLYVVLCSIFHFLCSLYALFLHARRSNYLVCQCKMLTKEYVFYCIFGCWFLFTFTCFLFEHKTLTFTCKESPIQSQGV